MSEEETALVRRLFYVDHLKVRTISERIGRHHSTVEKILFPKKSEEKKDAPAKGGGITEVLLPFLSFIHEKMSLHPNMPRTRLVEILGDKGVTVSVHQLRRFMAKHGGVKKSKQAFIKVRLVEGEQAQVDWAHCGTIVIDGATRKLSLFAMVLSYSRMIYARFYVDQCLESFLQAHVHAFQYFGGVPDRLLYDNLKTAVISRVGTVVQFNRDLVEFASKHYFTLDACNPRSGWEKGRVERAIRYVKESFLAGRIFSDLASANKILHEWLSETANLRPWPEGREKTVERVWEEKEKKALRAFSQGDEKIFRQFTVTVKKTPYIRFDLNDYSVPHRFVGESVAIFASEDEVRIFSAGSEIARHRRSYAKGKDVETREHVEALLKERFAARDQMRRRLVHSHLTNGEEFFKKIAEKGQNVSSARRRVYQLFERHSLEKIDQAMGEVLARDVASMAAVELILKNEAPCESRALDLSRYPHLCEIKIKQHDLAHYDTRPTNTINQESSL